MQAGTHHSISCSNIFSNLILVTSVTSGLKSPAPGALPRASLTVVGGVDANDPEALQRLVESTG